MTDQGSRYLEDLLGDGPTTPEDDDAPRGTVTNPGTPAQAQRPPLEPPAEPKRQGGLRPLISQKRTEIIELEKKIENHHETKAYERKGENGQSYFDYVAMQADQARLSRLNRELSELRERDREYATTAQSRAQTAHQVARTFLSRELAKLPKALQGPTGEQFAAIFKSLVDKNEFSKQQYADRQAVQGLLDQILSTAYGAAYRAAKANPEGAPVDSGLDEEEPQRKPEGEPEEDDFTNNLLYAYDRRRQGQMSVAEMKRQQAAAKGDNQ